MEWKVQCLNLCSSKTAASKTERKIWVQIVYLEDDPRKHGERTRWEGRVRGEISKGYVNDHCGHGGSNPLGCSKKMCRTCPLAILLTGEEVVYLSLIG